MGKGRAGLCPTLAVVILEISYTICMDHPEGTLPEGVVEALHPIYPPPPPTCPIVYMFQGALGVSNNISSKMPFKEKRPNVHSTKRLLKGCQRNILSMKRPVDKTSVDETSCRRNVLSMNCQSTQCPVNKTSCPRNVR